MNTPIEDTKLSVLVKVTREQQIEIEDICFKEGMGISQYLIGLHELSKKGFVIADKTVGIGKLKKLPNGTVELSKTPEFKTPAKIIKRKPVLKRKIKIGKK